MSELRVRVNTYAMSVAIAAAQVIVMQQSCVSEILALTRSQST